MLPRCDWLLCERCQLYERQLLLSGGCGGGETEEEEEEEEVMMRQRQFSVSLSFHFKQYLYIVCVCVARPQRFCCGVPYIFMTTYFYFTKGALLKALSRVWIKRKPTRGFALCAPRCMCGVCGRFSELFSFFILHHHASCGCGGGYLRR